MKPCVTYRVSILGQAPVRDSVICDNHRTNQVQPSCKHYLTMSDFAVSMDVDDESVVAPPPSTADDLKEGLRTRAKNIELAEELSKQRQRGQTPAHKSLKPTDKGATCPVIDCLLNCNKKRFCCNHFPAFENISRKTFPKQKTGAKAKEKVVEDDQNDEQKAFIKIFGTKSGEQLLSQYVLNATLAPAPPPPPTTLSTLTFSQSKPIPSCVRHADVCRATAVDECKYLWCSICINDALLCLLIFTGYRLCHRPLQHSMIE